MFYAIFGQVLCYWASFMQFLGKFSLIKMAKNEPLDQVVQFLQFYIQKARLRVENDLCSLFGLSQGYRLMKKCIQTTFVQSPGRPSVQGEIFQ